MNIISYCLYGDHPMYFKGMDENIKLRDKYFPDFEIWIYTDSDYDNEGADRIYRKEITKGETEPMFWRFEALEEDGIILIRDADSRLSQREKDAVDEWLESDCDIHIMRDHPWHTTEILGGMFGARNGGLNNITRFMNKWNKYDTKGDDQLFLKSIYPYMNNVYEHSEFVLKYKNITHPFPTQRNNFEFVGEVYDENNKRNPDHYKIIEQYESNNHTRERT